ncbi:transmembrane protein 169-like [Diadema antillarum]|uniref:transmembrane protein 169-like n=1 Tax=Diadema antillarum TaxID=105358 RepID=UPI003A84E46D
MASRQGKCSISIGPREGPHIVLLSLLSFPIVFLCAIFVAGYIGILTWYNIFLHFFDERTLCHRLTICPLLILTLPLILIVLTLGLSLYAAWEQVSWQLESWMRAARDPEKGFYARLCARLGLPECCPYEVIILREEGDSLELATEDVSLKGVPGVVTTTSESQGIDT